MWRIKGRGFGFAPFFLGIPMKLIRFLLDWFEVGSNGSSEVKFAAGTHYAVTDETMGHVARDIAEVVDAPADADKASAMADKAEAKADDAQANADAARAAADAAAAAQTMAQAAMPEPTPNPAPEPVPEPPAA